MNQFYDINKFPKEEGILWFPISMSRISNSQDAESCFKYLEHLNPSKIASPQVGLNFCYGDFLYLYSNEQANALKKKFSQLIINHKNACKKIIQKPHYSLNEKSPTYFIEKAFSFTVWNSLYLQYAGDFFKRLSELKTIYNKDPLFQKYLREDLEHGGRTELDENQLMFFLEEHLMMYLIAKGEVTLENKYVPNYKRFLICYPGPALKHHMYIVQQNFLKLANPENKYENCFYDLAGKKLYDASKMDLESYKYE